MNDQPKILRGPPGSRIRMQVTPQPVPASEAEAWRAAQPVPSSTAYLFEFPFDFRVDVGLRPVEVSNATRWVFYPPHYDPPSDDFQHQDWELIPRPRDSPAPGMDGLAVRPRTSSARPGGALGNGLRIDAELGVSVNHVEEVSEAYLRQLRARTLQWWIGRDRRESDSYLKHSFPVDAAGGCIGGVSGLVSYYEPLNCEVNISQTVLENAALDAVLLRAPPIHYELFLDGIYYHSVGEVGRVVLALGMAVESALASALDDLQSKGVITAADRRRVRRQAFHVRLDRGLTSLGFESYRSARPDDYTLLKEVWIARGKVAHGKSPLLVRGGRSRPLEHDDLLPVVKAVGELIEWLKAPPEAI